jgi:hypothetical protein
MRAAAVSAVPAEWAQIEHHLRLLTGTCWAGRPL